MNVGHFSAHNSGVRQDATGLSRSVFEQRVVKDESPPQDNWPSSTFGFLRQDKTKEAMSTSVFGARDVGDEKQEFALRTVGSHGPRSTTHCQSTHSGDVVVVEPSFDAGDSDNRSPGPERKTSMDECRSSPEFRAADQSKRGHSRNLSEHFQDATSLGPDTDERGHPQVEGSVIGQKHRRVFSGDVTHPANAHRRINSIGNSADVKRRPYRQERAHQRVDSAGLDILTAAVDATSEELAVAAGSSRNTRPSWSEQAPNRRRQPPPPPSSQYDQAGKLRAPARHYQHGPPPYYGPSYPPVHAYGPPPSYYPPSRYHRDLLPPPPSGGYPVQYAPGPADSYHKPPTQVSSLHPVTENMYEASTQRNHSPSFDQVRSEHPNVPGNAKHPLAPPSASGWNKRGSTQGVQTYVTAMGVGEGSRSLQANVPGPESDAPKSPLAGKHQRYPSQLSWPPPIYTAPAEAVGGDHPLKQPQEKHHRATSSISFLGGFDVGVLDKTDATFLQNLQAETGATAAAYKAPSPPVETSQKEPMRETRTKMASGGTSKRVRRKCTVDNCPNRVVQGGLCIAHGAKRKQCKHPGCTKNVKKAGLCSTHGPARKRCSTDGCQKVAVQGGRCIAHGAKKKICSIDNCSKQAILLGMCKKHHDQHLKNGIMAPPHSDVRCTVIETSSPLKPPVSRTKPTHTRGLSIFQEISADTVGDLLTRNGATESATPAPAPAPGHRHRSTFSREFGSLY